MFASSAQITELEREIKYLLNATKIWSGAVIDARRSDDAITYSRVKATMEVLKAIARNPSHGYWGELAELVAVAHDSSIPPHDGEAGVPWIVPFLGAAARSGVPADPDEIDSYRNDVLGQFNRVGGVSVPHNQADANGMPSPVAGFYSLVGAHFKFTGYSASVPMVQLSEEKCTTSLPVSVMATVPKIALKFHLKEGDNLPQSAIPIIQDGMNDLMRIEGGQMDTKPVAMIQQTQEQR